MNRREIRCALRAAVVGLLLFLPGAGWAARPDAISLPPLQERWRLPEKMQLDNQVPLYLLTDERVPLVDVTVLLAFGRSAVPPDQSGLVELVAEGLRSGGSLKRRPQQIDEDLDALAANLRVDSGPYSIELHLSLLREDLAAGVALLAELVQQPRFDAERFAIARQQLQENIRRRADQPQGAAQYLLTRQLYGSHPLGQPPTLATLATFDLEQVRAFYQRHAGPAHLWLAVSGAVDAGELLPLVNDAFGHWQAPVTAVPLPPLPPEAAAESLLVDRPLPQTTVLLAQRGIDKDNPDLYAVQVMNYILGGGGFNSRLMREIRSNRGLVYSVYSAFSVGRRLPGPFVAGCETRNDQVAEAVGLMRQEMERLRTETVTAAELELARESLINAFIFVFADSHQLVRRVMEQDYYGFAPDYLQRYRQRIAAVSAEDVRQVARRYLQPQRQQLILVGAAESLHLPPGGPLRQVAVETLLSEVPVVSP